MSKKSIVTVSRKGEITPLAFAFAIAPEVEAGSCVGMISTPTGGGLPAPEDDP